MKNVVPKRAQPSRRTRAITQNPVKSSGEAKIMGNHYSGNEGQRKRTCGKMKFSVRISASFSRRQRSQFLGANADGVVRIQNKWHGAGTESKQERTNDGTPTRSSVSSRETNAQKGTPTKTKTPSFLMGTFHAGFERDVAIKTSFLLYVSRCVCVCVCARCLRFCSAPPIRGFRKRALVGFGGLFAESTGQEVLR